MNGGGDLEDIEEMSLTSPQIEAKQLIEDGAIAPEGGEGNPDLEVKKKQMTLPMSNHKNDDETSSKIKEVVTCWSKY